MEVEVRPQTARLGLGRRVLDGGEDHDPGPRRRGPREADDLEPVRTAPLREADVGDEAVIRGALEERLRLLRLARAVDPEPDVLKVATHAREDVRLVVDDEEPRRASRAI